MNEALLALSADPHLQEAIAEISAIDVTPKIAEKIMTSLEYATASAASRANIAKLFEQSWDGRDLFEARKIVEEAVPRKHLPRFRIATAIITACLVARENFPKTTELLTSRTQIGFDLPAREVVEDVMCTRVNQAFTIDVLDVVWIASTSKPSVMLWGTYINAPFMPKKDAPLLPRTARGLVTKTGQLRRSREFARVRQILGHDGGLRMAFPVGDEGEPPRMVHSKSELEVAEVLGSLGSEPGDDVSIAISEACEDRLDRDWEPDSSADSAGPSAFELPDAFEAGALPRALLSGEAGPSGVVFEVSGPERALLSSVGYSTPQAAPAAASMQFANERGQ